MVPYVRKSFRKHYLDGIKYLSDYIPKDWKENPPTFTVDTSIEDGGYKIAPKVYTYAMDMLEKELKQAVEGMYHNLNSLQSRSGNQLEYVAG